MALFFVSAIAFIILYLIYDAYRTGQQLRQAEARHKITESKLQKSLANEHRLREEINALQAQLVHTFEDSITNLLGWHLFENRLKQYINESERYQLTFAIVFVDIDDFKIINDALNYEIGDALLQLFAKRLQTCIRKVDSITRFAKDTFVIMLTQLNKPETAAIVAQRILHSLKEPFQIKNHELYVTASIGIAVYPTDGQATATLLRSADHALHMAKESGKNSYQFYQKKMHKLSQRELALSNALSRENLFKDLVFYYQPIFDTQKKGVFCMDVKLHMQHSQLGMIDPNELFNLAEKQRKLNAISEAMLQNACRQFIKWRSLGFVVECVGMPLSVMQLENSSFIYRISQIMQEENFKPEWLLLEIKDHFAPFPFSVVEKGFNMLKYIGIKIAIDNFGSESFPLYYLENIRSQYLVLDSLLINDITQNPQTLAVVKTVGFLANAISVKVIVKGIETEEQIKLLKDIGFNLMQSHLLGDPILEDKVGEKLAMSL